MTDFKKIDDKDFVFVNRQFLPKEEKAFSDFLKIRKKKRGKKESNFHQNELRKIRLAINEH